MRGLDLDVWEEILTTITRNKVRSLLTAFGIFWGLFMLLALLGGSQGIQDQMRANFSGFATNTGFMFAEKTSKAYDGFRTDRTWYLQNKDLDLIRRQVTDVEDLSPVIMAYAKSVVNNTYKTSSAAIKGIRPDYVRIESPQLSHGRFISQVDIMNDRKVCVIGKRIYNDLFPHGGNPCGQFINIDGSFFQVVGVNVSDGNMNIGSSAENTILIPFSTAQRNYNRGEVIDFFCYTAKSGVKVSEVEKQILAILKRVHHISPDDTQAISSFNAEAMFEIVDNLFGGIKVLAWMVGLGTLIAGAIGVSNIMMVSVKERTSEIGIRRAIGAQPKDILFQILAESLVLTIMAGAIGLIFTVGILSVLQHATTTPVLEPRYIVSFTQAIGATLLLIVLGLLAGLAPALRAMSVKPIDAIRDE